MTPEEETLSNIQDMGYVTVTPRKVYPSYYKLTDGTILKAMAHLNFLLPDPRRPGEFVMNHTNIASVFVPQEKRRPELYKPYNPSELAHFVTDEDVEYEVLLENFSVYDLSNGFILSVKSVVGQVRKTSLVEPSGDPLYIVNINPVFKIKKQ